MIEENRELVMKNVLSHRGIMTKEKFNSSLIRLINYLEDNCIKRVGPIVTSTHRVVERDKVQYMDVEILIPIDDISHIKSEYTYKPIFKLSNALYSRVMTNSIEDINKILIEMNDYIKKKNYQQITNAYIAKVSNYNNILEHEYNDIFIGISKNIL